MSADKKKDTENTNHFPRADTCTEIAQIVIHVNLHLNG